jgi:hypothetical protein
MATLPKSNKNKMEEESTIDPLDTIANYLDPPVDDSSTPTAEEEPNLPEEGEKYFTSDLGERVYPVAKDPEKAYMGIESPDFNSPPLIASEEELDSWNPEMQEVYNKTLGSSDIETPESPSVYPYEFMQPDQRVNPPEYGPDGQLPSGLKKSDLTARVGEDPLDTIARYQKEKEFAEQHFIPAIVGIAKEINNWNTGKKIERLVNGAIADTLDWPYDTTMGFLNAALTKTGLDKSVGTFRVNNFRNFFYSMGYTFDEETEGQIEIDNPTLYYMADFMGTNIALLPASTFVALKNATAVSQPFLNEAAAKLAKRTYLGKKINLTTLANKIRSKFPFLKPLPVSETRATIRSSFDALKTSMGEIGQTTVQRPFFVPYMETVGSAGAGVGYALGKEFSDSPTVQLFTSLAGGLTFTSHLMALKTLGGLTSAAVQKIGGFVGVGARRRASNRLHELSGDDVTENMDAVLRTILNKESTNNLTVEEKTQYDIITKYLDPDVIDQLTPAQRAAAVGRDEYLPLEELIIKADKEGILNKQFQAQLKDLQDIMLRSFSESSDNVGFTREVFQLQQDYLKSLAFSRMQLAENRAATAIKEVSPKADEAFIGKTIRTEVESALEDISKQEDYLWSLVTMDKEVSPSSIIDVWKGLLKDRDRISDPEDLLLTGQNRDVLTRELGMFGPEGNWIPGNLQKRVDVPEGTIVQKGTYTSEPTVSIKLLQSLRRRLLKEIREQRKKGNHDKKRIMNEVQKSILNIFKQEADTIRMQKDPETGDFVADMDSQLGHIITAIEHSAVVNQKFNDDIVGELLGPSATAAEKVAPELTAEFIFTGTPLKQRGRVKKILEAVKRESILADQKKSKPPSLTKPAGMTEDESVLTPVTEAMKGFLRHQFIKKFVTEDAGKLHIKNPVAAANWIKLRQKTLFKEFPGLKNEFMEAVVSNSPGKLYGEGLPTEQIKQINKYLYNKDKQITVLFLEVEPSDIFNWSRKSALIAKTPVSNTKKVRQIFQKLASSAQKEPTGRAMRGLQESVFQWVINRSYIKKAGAGDEKTFSGANMSILLDEPKTRVIVDTILTKQQKEKLKVLEITANLIDSFRVSTPLLDKTTGVSQTITGDKTGWFLTKVGKVLGALAGRKLRTGTLQGPTEGSKLGEMVAGKMQVDWAERYLIHALMDSDPRHLAVLLQKTDTPAKAQEFDRYLKAFFAYTITEYNLPFPNIDQFGTIDGEENIEDDEFPGNVKGENEEDAVIKLKKVY